jgi:hypothetical protein
MNIIISIENPNEVQIDLIHLIAIQDKIKAAKRDHDQEKSITGAINQIEKSLTDAIESIDKNGGK